MGMLTQEDLEQIGKLMDGRLEPIKQDIQGLKGDVSVLKEGVQGVKQDVQDLRDGQVRLEQKIDRVEHLVNQDVELLGEFIVKMSEYMDDYAARIKRLEDHTGLSYS